MNTRAKQRDAVRLAPVRWGQLLGPYWAADPVTLLAGCRALVWWLGAMQRGTETAQLCAGVLSVIAARTIGLNSRPGGRRSINPFSEISADLFRQLLGGGVSDYRLRRAIKAAKRLKVIEVRKHYRKERQRYGPSEFRLTDPTGWNQADLRRELLKLADTSPSLKVRVSATQKTEISTTVKCEISTTVKPL